MGLNDRVSLDDFAAQVRGVNAFLGVLAKVWPQADAGELADRAQQLEASPLAQELLFRLLDALKVRV